MNTKHRKTLELIFENPIRSDIEWIQVKDLLKNLGAEIREARGSRLRIQLNQEKIVFHRPHPRKVICKGAIRSLRKFLEIAGVKL